jgi:hypothetical protein
VRKPKCSLSSRAALTHGPSWTIVANAAIDRRRQQANQQPSEVRATPANQIDEQGLLSDRTLSDEVAVGSVAMVDACQ